MTIVVTGGAGFIGSNFIFHMLQTYPDYRIVCLDKLTYAGNLSTLKGVMDAPNFRFVRLDICDREGVVRLFSEEHPDAVVNFAAESHVDRSLLDPAPFFRTNVEGTRTLLDVSRRSGVKRYHQVSTDEVYGALPLVGGQAFTEQSALHPNNAYSESKARADEIVLQYAGQGFPATISRCGNNLGPYQHPEKLIPLMIVNALADQPLPVYGTGENVRDWLYVEDHCRAIDLILHEGRSGEVYNVGGHNEMRNIDVVNLICKELDMICAMRSMQPRSETSSAGCLKPRSGTASEELSDGIWIIGNGGRRSSRANIRVTAGECTGIVEKKMERSV